MALPLEGFRILSLAEQWIDARRIEWNHRLDRLGAYLEVLKAEDAEPSPISPLPSATPHSDQGGDHVDTDPRPK